jgi:hypothetical protein
LRQLEATPRKHRDRRGALPCIAAVLAAACAAKGAIHPSAPVPGRDTFLRLERTECLGRCPIYTVTLYEDGVARYHGGRDALPGTRWRKIEPAEVARLMDDAVRIAPWTCEPDRIETDHPQAIVTVSRGGRSRRIVHDHGDPCAPDAMWQLEGGIDVAGGHPQLLPHAR